MADPVAPDVTGQQAGTTPTGERFAGMDDHDIWLVTNVSSGSNDDEALEALAACLAANGFRVAKSTVFPDDELPTRAVLEASGVTCVAVFTGDGTINSLLAGLSGWGGAVLVLPGGTMNLLYHRLHGERSLEETLAAVARDEAARRRPSAISCAHGTAFAGVLAGPGASWGRVREAMRESALAEVAGSAVSAIGETLGGEMIACLAPQLGEAEGYPLINLTPREDGIEVDAYSAQTPGEYLEQAWALLRRDFRQGPHDELGLVPSVTLAGTEGHPFGLLLDGEEVDAGATVEFRLVACEVDLVATQPDGR